MSGKRFLYPNDFKACDYCHGKGTVYCSSCNGRGSREIRRYNSYTGYSETERESCTICHQTGNRMCNHCGGTGDQKIFRPENPESEPNFIDEIGFENAGNYGPSRSKDEYFGLYNTSLQEAEQQRQNIIEWVLNAQTFPPDYQMQFIYWIEKLSFDQPETIDFLDITANQLIQSGISREVLILRDMIRHLSTSCLNLQTYKLLSR